MYRIKNIKVHLHAWHTGWQKILDGEVTPDDQAEEPNEDTIDGFGSISG